MRILFLIIALTLVSCSNTPIQNIDYKKYNLYTSSNPSDVKYEDLGPVNIYHSSFAWDSCSAMAEKAISEALAIVKQRGGNAIINVQWTKQGAKIDSLSPVPQCNGRWGWFALYIVGGLGPWIKNVEITGTIAKIKDEKISTLNTNDIFINPELSEEENIKMAINKLLPL